MKLTTTQLQTLLATPIIKLTEPEFHAIAFLLDWQIVAYEQWTNALHIRIKHEGTTIDIRWVANIQQSVYIGPPECQPDEHTGMAYLNPLQLVHLLRQYYMREYAVTIWKQPTGPYDLQEIETMGHLLTNLIFH